MLKRDFYGSFVPRESTSEARIVAGATTYGDVMDDRSDFRRERFTRRMLRLHICE